MGQTVFAGLTTSDLTGSDSNRSIITTMDEQFNSSPTSNMQKIDRLFESQNTKLTHLAQKQHIITIGTRLQSSIEGTDYYIAESDDLTEYTNEMILLLQFDRNNTGNVSININGLGDLFVYKIDNNENEIALVKGDISSKVKYFF